VKLICYCYSYVIKVICCIVVACGLGLRVGQNGLYNISVFLPRKVIYYCNFITLLLVTTHHYCYSGRASSALLCHNLCLAFTTN